jgi:DNA-binding NarL/FixJ family response regulator
MRVVIVEDHGWLREALAEALPGRGVEVVGTAGDAGAALDVVDRVAPDVAILDIRLPPTYTDEGLRVAEILRDRYPEVGLLILSTHADAAFAERLLNLHEDARAVGYLLKERVGDLGEVVAALGRIAAGEVVVDPLIITRLMSRRRARDPLEALTPYERRVLALVAEGRSNLGIAQELGVQISTVEKHLTNITSKLGLPGAEGQDRRKLNVRVLAALTFLRSAHNS